MDEQAGQAKVSERGQLNLPARARHRWGLERGGELGWVDLGDVMVLVPGGIAAARSAVLAQVDQRTWDAAGLGFGDADLANE